MEAAAAEAAAEMAAAAEGGAAHQEAGLQQAAAGVQTQEISSEIIQKYLDENQILILSILEAQQSGRLAECAAYQQKLQQNLMYLAAVADAQPIVSMQSQEGGGASAHGQAPPTG